MARIRYIQFVFLLMACTSLHAQPTVIRPQIQPIVDSIAKQKTLITQNLRCSSTNGKAQNWFSCLFNEADIDELEILASHNNPIVRCYAFTVLVKRKSPSAYSVLLKHLKDADPIHVFDYDIGYDENVGEYLKHTFSANEKQRRVIDSLLKTQK
jgi:hypothetical protein